MLRDGSEMWWFGSLCLGYGKPFAMILRGTSNPASEVFERGFFGNFCELVSKKVCRHELLAPCLLAAAGIRFVDQSRALPDTNLQKLRVDRCKVGWLANNA